MQNGVSMRGDLAPINMGTYVIIRDEVILRPTYSKQRGKLKYIGIEIGNNV